MRHRVIPLLWLGLLAACSRPTPEISDTPTQTKIAAPAPHVGRSARVDAFLQQRYGSGAGLAHDSWPGELDGEAVDSAVCAEQAVVVDDAIRQLLAVCHTVRDAGDGTTGRIDFWQLRPEGTSLAVIAERHAVEFGSNGNPGAVEILRLGSEMHGFVVHSYAMARGLMLGTQSIVIAGPTGLTDAGWIRGELDNSGEVTCDEVPAADTGDGDGDDHTIDTCNSAFALMFDLRVDNADLLAKVWPLAIHEHGNDCGTPIDTWHVVEFDAQRGRYAIPDDLQRESCR